MIENGFFTIVIGQSWCGSIAGNQPKEEKLHFFSSEDKVAIRFSAPGQEDVHHIIDKSQLAELGILFFALATQKQSDPPKSLYNSGSLDSILELLEGYGATDIDLSVLYWNLLEVTRNIADIIPQNGPFVYHNGGFPAR